MYHYEVLGDERFQEFCEALIAASFPNVQCLPVGQPDGGRDAYWIRHFLQDNRSKLATRDLVVFQVKFVKSPSDTRSERDMIEDIVKKERPKIEKLKAAGLNKYYLITNLKGTSHLDVGSIDRVNHQLSELLGIEAYCWWRDDLDRRLDGNSSIKWSYPEILKATDLLGALVIGNLGEEEERRRGAIRAYLTAQYEDDEELKFKQTELRSNMTELFVDLPMQPSIDIIEPESPRLAHLVRHGVAMRVYNSQLSYADFDHVDRKSAEYFIKSDVRSKLSRSVLEGAPGQGKSTVTQYICQVMRMQLLDKVQELSELPRQYSNAQVRLPFRVDLRDLAKWIAGIDPFQSKVVELDDREPRSLEGFLAGQVRHFSGGHGFNVSDLTAVARASHLFLALDGFDEVADIELRQQLVSEITKGTTRLMNAGGFSVQTIVTSRPAAFAKSVRFPRDQWAYFELLPLERKQVDDYTTKWMKAKGVKEAEQHQLRRILDTKLQEAHTQFLAKNPMQLTILLSLIHNRGASLPEKRTAMYDAYMDMFFSRESEKSEVVRDNRELLIDIHRYLAWKLQTAAEAGENGSIEKNALRATLLLYLDAQGENTRIVTELFNGIIERVGALVSRVQETYEFEVQPLREYFAARHLYETAPYSPPGDEKSGTKLDRFDALLRNPYWLNVARFYGGCFSKGEISALVDELISLSETEPYKLTSHPRSVALMLLSDWVFTQYQPAVKKIVAFIGDYPQLRQLLANAEQVGATGWSSLPDRSGRQEFLEILWQQVVKTGFMDERRALARAIAQNSSLEERTEQWKNTEALLNHRDWVTLGGMLQVFSSEKFLTRISMPVILSVDFISKLLEAGQFSFLESSQHFALAKHILLNNLTLPGVVQRSKRNGGDLAKIASISSYYQYGLALNDESAVSIKHLVDRRFGEAKSDKGIESEKLLSAAKERNADNRAFEAHCKFLDTSSAITSTSVIPWVELVEVLRVAWGDCPAIDRIAFLGAGVRSRDPGVPSERLGDASDLVSAARFVRWKSGAPRWWEERLQNETDGLERRRLLLLLWRWGTLRTIIKISSTLKPVLDSLDPAEWGNLCADYGCLQYGARQGIVSNEINRSDLMLAKNLGSRLCMFLGMRLTWEHRYELAVALSSPEMQAGQPELQFAMDNTITALRQKVKIKLALHNIKYLYLKGASGRYFAQREDLSLSKSIATNISNDSSNFPLPLIAFADGQLRSVAGASAAKLLDIANRDAWF